MLTIDKSPERRLEDWRQFRKSLQGLSENDQLIKVAEYWSATPLVTWCINDLDSTEWPTPWELIHDGEFCKSGISYLMYETLLLADPAVWTKNRMQLIVIKDKKNSEMFLILIIDNEFILNYSHGEVMKWATIKDYCDIICVHENIKD